MTSATAHGERRWHPRSAVVATAVVLTAKKYAGQYLVENLSAGGALLVGDARLEPGERLKMLLHLPGQKPISLSAEVIRRQVNDAQECLFAVAFRHLSPGIEDTIQQVVLAMLERLHDASHLEVLVIDDSREVCRALERDLRALGRRAVSAVTPLDAVGRLNDGARHIDTAIVDLRLGHADGLEFLTFLSDGHPGVRRILMSGNIRPCQLELAVTSGRAHAVLDKPWSRESLAKAIAT